MIKRLKHLLKKSIIATASLYAVLFASMIGVQMIYDRSYPHVWSELSDATYIFPEKVVTQLSFGFQNVFADYYWIKAIQDLSIKGDNFQLYLRYFYNISALDRHFLESYVFAVYMLPSEHKQKELLNDVAVYAKKGMASNPDSWEIPYYLGFQYHLVNRSYQDALYYFTVAASKPHVPPQVISAYRGYLTRSVNEDKITGSLMKVILETSQNNNLKDFVRKDLVLEYLTKGIEKGALAYKEKHKVFPSTLKELVKENLVTLPVDFEERVAVIYNQTNGTVNLSFKENDKK